MAFDRTAQDKSRARRRRVTFDLDPHEVRELDRIRDTHGFRSRTEAFRMMLRLEKRALAMERRYLSEAG